MVTQTGSVEFSIRVPTMWCVSHRRDDGAYQRMGTRVRTDVAVVGHCPLWS